MLAPAPAVIAADYLSLADAQRAIFPDALRFAAVALQPTAAQLKAIAALAGVQPARGRLAAWRVFGRDGELGFFFTDEVVGRQDFIDYALGINADGSLRAPEIMSYRESHGGEVRNAAWRAQFAHRSNGATLRPAIDIRNIAGATLSCEHLTAGVRYLAALWQLLLRDGAGAPG
ncbi:MAG: FMN-binding protein [Gammaproteobacteria bacterium]|nr:FMN-binding protein [Gammaproteobacteria bacterium]MDE2251767.1 FMN-binding protein [Gammaproteobacteria bacterium]